MKKKACDFNTGKGKAGCFQVCVMKMYIQILIFIFFSNKTVHVGLLTSGRMGPTPI